MSIFCWMGFIGPAFAARLQAAIAQARPNAVHNGVAPETAGRQMRIAAHFASLQGLAKPKNPVHSNICP
ncbi:hypothetical protein [Comamonas terrae]|uniref:Uncharacterized protein n=1 Tax=Comamonas terrae TaxID=673548 RepID=A0ABW5US73_9BURK|nr:hypothetical protein [Comamonas terrae]